MHKTSLHSYLGTLLDVNFEGFFFFFFSLAALGLHSKNMQVFLNLCSCVLLRIIRRLEKGNHFRS